MDNSTTLTAAEIKLKNEELAQLGAEIDGIERQWPKAVEHAKQMPEGAMRSAWTMPLEVLTQRREEILARLGVPAEDIKTPRRIAAGEKELPDHVRGAFRRGDHLKDALASAHAGQVKAHRARERGKKT